ncbi:MAG TPA: hypothetical protein VEQ59_06595 [Polyangiaceae bacterium]|nr:hypothetical protein [Polyangiaceae bacterium]
MLDHRAFVLALWGATSLIGCSSEPLDDESHDNDSAPIATENVSLTLVYEPTAKIALSATALAFNAAVEGELWVALRQFPSGLPCTMDDESGCAALPGVMAVIGDATSSAPRAVLKEDGNAWHFMRRPTAVAWGDGELFSSCGEALTDNYEDVDIPYAGPALWSSDPSIFGVKPKPGQNGTHIDMLHETPRCMGLAHESGNVFWAFNGDAGSLDRVDFHEPHEIGGEDHDDGEVHRYIAGQLLRVPEVPSHLAYDGQRQLVYVADTGHARVLAVDPSTASAGGDIDVWEVLQASGSMDGATVRELVRPGTLQSPSGLALSNGRLYVTDNATGLIHVYDVSGKPERVLDTGLPAGSLAGIVVGPDQKLYVTDLLTGRVQRVEGSDS